MQVSPSQLSTLVLTINVDVKISADELRGALRPLSLKEPSEGAGVAGQFHITPATHRLVVAAATGFDRSIAVSGHNNATCAASLALEVIKLELVTQTATVNPCRLCWVKYCA